jgi:hypothetical protein
MLLFAAFSTALLYSIVSDPLSAAVITLSPSAPDSYLHQLISLIFSK